MSQSEKICIKEMKDKNIVFFDIDDTLYAPKLGVPESTVRAIKQLRENGDLAFICTGRAKSMIFPFINEIGFDGIVAGAGTYAEYNGEVLFRQDMTPEAGAKAVREVRDFGFIPIPEGHDHIYFEHESKWNKAYGAVHGLFIQHIADIMRQIPENEEEMCIAKVSSAFDEKSDLQGAIEHFKDEYTVINHGNFLLELIPKGSSKAVGIKRVLNELGLSYEKTYALGDSMNDYEMIDYVKHGIAMGNSEQAIKDIADYVTDRIECDGVAKALTYFGLVNDIV